MPELPDILSYVDALRSRLVGRSIESIVVRSPNLLKTYSPSIECCCGPEIKRIDRNGKRIVWEFANNHYLVFHLMIAGRFHWKTKPMLPRGKSDLAAFRLQIDGHPQTLMLTEASTQHRASLWCFDNVQSVMGLDRGGLDVLNAEDAAIIERLRQSNNTLKRALTDPRRFDGIGNAYSDEILHAAGLSPLKRTLQLSDSELARLCEAMRSTLQTWIDRLQLQLNGKFPEKVTAFHPEMAVHGKFGHHCPNCQAPIQRIRYAENECNYCPGCQTEGRILADRSLSRLLKDDWPKTIEDLEA